MRPIKFRGKRLDNGEWIYGDLLHTTGGKVEIHWLREEKDGDLNPWWAAVDPATIGQFPGLFDKNGAEIYEHDLLQYINDCGEIFIGMVVFHEGGLYVYNAKNADDDYMETISYVVNSYDVEIIGNSELLKNE